MQKQHQHHLLKCRHKFREGGTYAQKLDCDSSMLLFYDFISTHMVIIQNFKTLVINCCSLSRTMKVPLCLKLTFLKKLQFFLTLKISWKIGKGMLFD